MVTKTIPNDPYVELDGVCEEYYENGQLESKTTYKNGEIIYD